MRNNIKMSNALWDDCETDDERVDFLQCGRAVETGIIAQAITQEVALAFYFRSEIMKERNQFIVVSYYTRNSHYIEEANNLIETMIKLNIPYDVQEIENLGDWHKNTLYKGQFVKDMMLKHSDKNIVWIDADARFAKFPELFNTLKADIACHVINWKDYVDYRDAIEWASGTVFIANNDKGKYIVDRWIENNNKQLSLFDQKNLQIAIEDNIGMCNFENLPPEYCRINDTMQKITNPVICHGQASHKYKYNTYNQKIKILFLMPQIYFVDWQEDFTNYELRLPILNCGLEIEHKDICYTKYKRQVERHLLDKEVLETIESFKPNIVINCTVEPHRSISPECCKTIMSKNIIVFNTIWETYVNNRPHITTWFETCNYCGVFDSLTNYFYFRKLAEGKQEPKGVIFTPGNIVFTDLINKKPLNKIYDVLIIGSYEGKRKEYVNYLASELPKHNIKFTKLGGLWDDSLVHPSVSGIYKPVKEWMPWKDYIQAINQAKICINTQTQKERDEIKGKVMQFLACGTFALLDNSKEIQGIVSKDYVDYFGTKEECLEKCIYWIKHEKEREEKALKGWQWFHNTFHYKRFWGEFILSMIHKRRVFSSVRPISEDKDFRLGLIWK